MAPVTSKSSSSTGIEILFQRCAHDFRVLSLQTPRRTLEPVANSTANRMLS
jgi:hypothetical protein